MEIGESCYYFLKGFSYFAPPFFCFFFRANLFISFGLFRLWLPPITVFPYLRINDAFTYCIGI